MGQQQSPLRRRIIAHLTQQHTHAMNALLGYSRYMEIMSPGSRARVKLLQQEIERQQANEHDEEKMKESKLIKLDKVMVEMRMVVERNQTRARWNHRWNTAFANRVAFPCTSDAESKALFERQSDIELFTQCANPLLRLVECIAFQQDIEHPHKSSYLGGVHRTMRGDLHAMLQESSQLIDILIPTITNEKEAQVMLQAVIGSLALHHVVPIMQRWNLDSLPVRSSSLLQTLLSFELHEISFLPVLSLLQFGLDPTDVPPTPAPSCLLDPVDDDDAPMQPIPFLPRSALEWARDDILEEDKKAREQPVWFRDPPSRLPPLPPDYNFSDPESMDLCTQLLAAPWWEIEIIHGLRPQIEETRRRAQFPHALVLAWKQHSRQVYERISQAEVMIPPLVEIAAQYLDLDWK